MRVGVVRDNHSNGAGTGTLSQGGEVASRRVHNLEVAGSTPALATITTLAGRGLPHVCYLPTPPALSWPGIFIRVHDLAVSES